MKILVSGGQGQLGRALATVAAGINGTEVIAVGRELLDLERPGELAGIVARIAPDAVINCAAFTAVDRAEVEPDRAERVNVLGAAALAHAARAARARFVAISTDYVFDGPPGTPLAEDAPTRPLNVYGRTKRDGEVAVLDAAPDATVVRTAWLHSAPGPCFVSRILVAPGPVLDIVDDQWGSPTNAFHLARALLGMLHAGRTDPAGGTGQIYHLANHGGTSWARLAEHALAAAGAGAAPRVRRVTSADRPGARRPNWSVLDCSRFRRDFRIALPFWRDGVLATVNALGRDGRGWTGRRANG